MVCYYSSPNIPLDKYREDIDKMMQEVTSSPKEAVAMGDFNGKSPQWGSPTSDMRGEYWIDWIAASDMVVHNDGRIPTWSRGRSESYIDITCSTQKIASHIKEWEVSMEESLSDHRHIFFQIAGIKKQDNRGKGKKFLLDRRRFRTNLEREMGALPVDSRRVRENVGEST